MFSNRFYGGKKLNLQAKFFFRCYQKKVPAGNQDLQRNCTPAFQRGSARITKAVIVSGGSPGYICPVCPENIKGKEGESSILSTSHNASAQPRHPSIPGAMQESPIHLRSVTVHLLYRVGAHQQDASILTHPYLPKNLQEVCFSIMRDNLDLSLPFLSGKKIKS